MIGNCNLELRLSPSAFSYSSYYNGQYSSMLNGVGEIANDKKQQLTIFYNGRIAACDVTELQARALISLASREMEEKSNSSPGSDPTSPMVNRPLCSPASGLSMKRSLQRFLQKRKTRAQSTYPYPILRHSN
ncbi:hypothetical protein BUALT_Bualt03G0024700 [Buddleja alternifolia]|uniref:Protein TIFY n=1 Tax=Buddleja alternifolia TaxID=168488 RepID=A0AAV6XXB8_9LAMI|nr:hypothetical protein BUALT_Bualt03G0024700 [Buddleja alternifolia]